MFRLTLDLESSAWLLGVDPRTFLEHAQREQLGGLLRFDDRWVVSIFTLARLLDTSAQALLEMIEDYALGELMNEAENDEALEGEISWQTYHFSVTVR